MYLKAPATPPWGPELARLSTGLFALAAIGTEALFLLSSLTHVYGFTSLDMLWVPTGNFLFSFWVVGAIFFVLIMFTPVGLWRGCPWATLPSTSVQGIQSMLLLCCATEAPAAKFERM